jgi:two-component system, cell cycle response regulator
VAEQLRKRIDEEPFVLFPGLPPLAVTLSIGVAVLGRHDERHIDTVLHHADKALYRAKGNGRNQVMVAPAA